MKNMEINTKRLLLRHITLSDAEDAFYGWANDERVTRYLTWKPHKDVESLKKIIHIWLEDYKNGFNFRWCIVLKQTGKTIGMIDVVQDAPKTKTAGLGYCIGYDYWGKGIVAEALIAVRDYLFDEAGYNRVEAAHHINNLASGKVMQKAGMQYEGAKRQSDIDNEGNPCDMVCYAMLKSDKR